MTKKKTSKALAKSRATKAPSSKPHSAPKAQGKARVPALAVKRVKLSKARLFRNIEVLLTLDGAANKGGRHVRPEDLGRIEKAAILEVDGRIVWVGPQKKLPKDLLAAHAVQDVDLKGCSVIPALVESHTHLVFAGNRAGEFERRNQGESYQSIAESGGGILATMRATRKAKLDELVRSGQVRADRFVSQGVVTIESKSGYALDKAGELKMLEAAGKIERARVVRTFLGAHAIPPEFSSASDYVDHLIDEVLPVVKKRGLACRVDIFCEKGYFDRELTHRYLSEALSLGFDLVVHADQLTHSGGAQIATALGARSAEHLIQIDDVDIKALAASETTSVLLPSADLYMKCAYPPARKLLDAGARVALATDFNPGSSPSQDVALVGVLARIEMKMSFAETLAAYTVGGAYALGLQAQIGSLEAGKLCDFVTLSGPIEELFLEIGRMPVAAVYREGRKIS